MKAMWKSLTKYPTYSFSDMGELKTFNWKNKGVERIMKPALDEKGYLRTMLKNADGKFDTVKVHRIIAQAFLPQPEGMNEVNHINGIKTDNRIENLEWSNRRLNIKHAFETGLCKPKGKGVVDSVSGVYYPSISEAARQMKMPDSTLQSMISGYRKNTTNMQYA